MAQIIVAAERSNINALQALNAYTCNIVTRKSRLCQMREYEEQQERNDDEDCHCLNAGL